MVGWVEKKVWLEETGETLTLNDWASNFHDQEPCIIASTHLPGLMVYLDGIFEDDSSWQFQLIQMRQRSEWQGKSTTINRFLFAYCGFRRAHGSDKSCFHWLLDPDEFELKLDFTQLIDFARAYRQFLQENDLPFRGTAGSLGNQLLRDERFYPEPRRKVPAATNEKVRAALPGNYYRLMAARDRYYQAVYFDQVSAHHFCALSTDLPDANSLLARGHFRDLPDKCWISPYQDKWAWNELRANHRGLLYCRVTTPKHGIRIHHPLLPPSGSSACVFIFTNEIEYLESQGLRIAYIIAAWTSDAIDNGLKTYSYWALQQIEQASAINRKWIKRILLATYGVLASRPDTVKIGYKRAKTGEPQELPVYGNEWVTVIMRELKRRESPITNVIHRGMIEAETRLRSIGFAQFLRARGVKILCIYADSVLVNVYASELWGRRAVLDPELIPPEWAIKGRLTNLRFLNDTSFVSEELIRLPGISGPQRNELAAATRRA